MNVAATAKTKAQTLSELRKHDGTLYVKNNTPFKVNMHDAIGEKRVAFELNPAGEPESITVLPKLALESAALRRMWLSGKVTVSTDESMEEQITLLMTNGLTGRDERMSNMTGLDAEGNPITPEVVAGNKGRDMHEKACLECGKTNQHGEIVAGRVYQNTIDLNRGVPPLCDLHKDLFAQFVPRQVSVKGVEHWEFDRMGMAPTVIQPR